MKSNDNIITEEENYHVITLHKLSPSIKAYDKDTADHLHYSEFMVKSAR